MLRFHLNRSHPNRNFLSTHPLSPSRFFCDYIIKNKKSRKISQRYLTTNNHIIIYGSTSITTLTFCVFSLKVFWNNSWRANRCSIFVWEPLKRICHLNRFAIFGSGASIGPSISTDFKKIVFLFLKRLQKLPTAIACARVICLFFPEIFNWIIREKGG